MPLDEYQLIQFALKVGAAILVFLFGRWLARRARAALTRDAGQDHPRTIDGASADFGRLLRHHAGDAHRRAGHGRFPDPSAARALR